MNIIRRLGLIVAVALTVDAFIMAPVFPQQGEVAARNARVMAVHRVGKFAEAVPVPQQALAIAEKGLPPRAVATALNNLATLYKHQSRYTDAGPLSKRRPRRSAWRLPVPLEHANTHHAQSMLAIAKEWRQAVTIQ
jgi:hypothetical protein